MTRERAQELDQAVLRAARGVRVLSSIAWGPEVEAPFLDAWRAAKPG